MARYLEGLSSDQKRIVNHFLEPYRRVGHHGLTMRGDKPLEGWFLFRAPTTIHPPTTLGLRHYSKEGSLLREIHITLAGITRDDI